MAVIAVIAVIWVLSLLSLYIQEPYSILFKLDTETNGHQYMGATVDHAKLKLSWSQETSSSRLRESILKVSMVTVFMGLSSKRVAIESSALMERMKGIMV